jgi:hypothetical protein
MPPSALLPFFTRYMAVFMPVTTGLPCCQSSLKVAMLFPPLVLLTFLLHPCWALTTSSLFVVKVSVVSLPNPDLSDVYPYP